MLCKSYYCAEHDTHAMCADNIFIVVATCDYKLNYCVNSTLYNKCISLYLLFLKSEKHIYIFKCMDRFSIWKKLYQSLSKKKCVWVNT